MEQTLPDITLQEQFREWVLNYSDLLFSYAVHRGLDHSQAKDLVQDTFYAAWKNRQGFEGRASVKNWLFAILKNKITDHYRAAAKSMQVLLSEYDPQFDEAEHWAKPAYPKALTIDPYRAADQAELSNIVERCSAKLNAAQKTVFIMKYVDELDSSDICQQLSITANNYWILLHRAKVQLRACLEKNWFLIKNV